MALLGIVNSGAALSFDAVQLTSFPMEKDRKAKVTPETKAEAKRLRALWDSRSHPNQAVFGEVYGVGNQSAVGQFLRGETPLSLKAAQGFARGLDCKVEDFSPRLAAKAAEIAGLVPGGQLTPEVAAIAVDLDQLSGTARSYALRMCREVLAFAKSGGNPVTQTHEPKKKHA